ncbi:MAG: DUF21 domain-containing protein [Phycisphaerae bacterium]|nr:DUF21 domain-containing protein [Phycisphaerae bacterium]
MLWILVATTVVALALSAFYSGCETGLYCLNTVRLELGRRSGRRSSILLGRMLRDREGIIATTLVGTNLANYLATACVVSILSLGAMSEQKAEVVTTLLLTPIIFVFAEVTPKNLFRREADHLMRRLVWPLRISDLLFRATGVIALLKGLARFAARLVGFGRARSLIALEPRQRITAMLREGVGAGVLSEEQSAMVDRVMSLSSVQVRSAMIPRDKVHAVSVDATRADVVELTRSHSYSRMPVTDPSDKVVGVLRVFDVLADASAEDGRERSITDFVSPPLLLEPDQSITAALTTMQRHGVPMAILVGPQDKFLGIITVKDLVEEIVGDLQAW